MAALSLTQLAKMASKWESQEKMPVLFVGHGNPMNALYDNDITRSWRKMGEGLHPKAILVISAHWQTPGTFVTIAPKPKTIHDFGGFPQELFDMQYPAPGAPEIAQEVIGAVQGISVEEDHEWGLDHGAWSVLVKMFPDADVPVFQMSMDYRKSPEFHYELAGQLQFLRSKGVLIVGSGNIVHNLRMARWNSDQPYEWAVEFDQETKTLLEDGNHQALVNYQKLGQDAALSIPTNEHYLPMLYTLGLQTKQDDILFFNEAIDLGSISMRSFVLG